MTAATSAQDSMAPAPGRVWSDADERVIARPFPLRGARRAGPPPVPAAPRARMGRRRLTTIATGVVLAAAFLALGAGLAAAGRLPPASATPQSSPVTGPAAWAGPVSAHLSAHVDAAGWAPGSPAWAAGLLTAKPAHQAALSESLGEWCRTVAAALARRGVRDRDLTAAGRLLSHGSTADDIRAAVLALDVFERRARRGPVAGTATMLSAPALSLLDAWATRSMEEIAGAGEAPAGAIGEAAAAAAARGRADAALAILSGFGASGADPAMSRAVSAAEDAWREVRAYEPFFLLALARSVVSGGEGNAEMARRLSMAREASRALADRTVSERL